MPAFTTLLSYLFEHKLNCQPTRVDVGLFAHIFWHFLVILPYVFIIVSYVSDKNKGCKKI